jgi:molybdopterin adenylyltransferase
MRVAILTVSDSVAQGKREDRSGAALAERARQRGWEVAAAAVLPDDREAIAAKLVEWIDAGSAELVLTTGGTGLGPRDVTPEATAAVADRLVPGLAERMRQVGAASNPRAVLSRGVAGTRGRALVVNLPGSPRGAVESLDAVAELLPHALEVLAGARHD